MEPSRGRRWEGHGDLHGLAGRHVPGDTAVVQREAVRDRVLVRDRHRGLLSARRRERVRMEGEVLDGEGRASSSIAGAPSTTTGAPSEPPTPAARPGPGTAALIAARNRSRAAASPAAPRFNTATLARRPSPSTPKNTIPAADSDKRADRRNGPN